MSNKVDLSCACGKVKGELTVELKSAFHVHCLCCDCQSFASYLNNETNILDQHGGSELFQTYPQLLKITEGQEHIQCVQLRNKGLFRWHTSCCNMPIANTMNSAKVPFIGVSVKLMRFKDEQEKQNTLGPVTMKAYGKYAIGEMPEDTHATFPISYMPKILKFMIKGFIKQKSNPSPFFKDGKAITKVNVLS